jgi:hypothetical protein
MTFMLFTGTGFSSYPSGAQKILIGGLTQMAHPASQDWSFLFARFGKKVRPRTNKKVPLSSTKRPLCPGLDSNQHMVSHAAT